MFMKKLSTKEVIAVGITLVVVLGILFFGDLIFQASQAPRADFTDNQFAEPGSSEAVSGQTNGY